MTIFLKLLVKRNFWPLFGTMSLGAFNDNFMRQAMIFFLSYGSLQLSSTDRGVMSSLATALMVLPFFLFSSLAGELADRYHKSLVLKINKTFEYLVMVLAAYYFMTQNLSGLFVVIFLMGTQSAFFGPVKYGMLPELVDKGELMAGNGLFSGATFLAIVLGTMAGAYLVTVPSGQALLLPCGLVLVGGLSLLFALRQPRSGLTNPEVNIDPLFWRSSYRILKSVKDNKPVWLAILAISWFWGMGGILLTQMPVFAATDMGARPEISSTLVTLFAVGIAVGSLLVNKLTKGNVTASLVPVSAALMTVLSLALGYATKVMPKAGELSFGVAGFLASPNHMAIAILSLLLTLAGGIFVVPLYAFIQREAAPGQRARIIAANNILNSVFMVAGSLIVSFMLKMGFDIPDVFIFIGLTAFIVTLLTVYFLTEETFRAILKVVLAIVFRPKVSGLENLSSVMKGPAIVICNHLSFADVALLVAYIPRSLTFAIDVYRSRAWWVRFFTNFYKTVPVNPAQPMGTMELISALDRGEMLVIFPEGRLNNTGSIMKVYDGAAMVVDRANCEVVPVILEDLEYTVFGRLGKIRAHKPKKLEIKMTVFPPVHLSKTVIPSKNRHDHRKKVTEAIYDLLSTCRSQCQNIDINLFRALERAGKRFGLSRPILEDTSRKVLTYGQVIRASKVLGRRLSGLPGTGRNIGVLLPNSIPLAAVAFGLWAGAKVPVMLNYSQGRRNVQLAIKQANLSAVITSRKFIEAGRLESLLEGLQANVVYLEDLSLSLLDKIKGLLWRPKPSAPSETAVILFTSGSEGTPKGVALSHKNMFSDSIQARTLVEIHEDDIFFNPMPAFHAYGLNVGLVLPLVLGLRLFLHPSPLQVKSIPELVYDTKATIIISSDSFAHAWGSAAHQYDFHW
ncbi:MAG: MFS transporter, partial [Deltaproteobacteria bacterium]|nr:MFS transporter [Deltaproteobacteria bacterium]